MSDTATATLVRSSIMAGEPTPDEIATRGLYRPFGLTDGEYERAVELLGRRPTYTETGMVSVLWSEHCCYKSTRHLLATLPTTGEQVIQGPGENAGVVDTGHRVAAAFKIESHNHPSAVEPYQGAATGVGGILRDVWAMGARPVALLNSLRFGPIDGGSEVARTRFLFDHVVEGIAGYGNCIGVPTVGGEVVFDEAYRHNPLVNAMCVGLIAPERLATAAAGGVGNPVLVIGARTGRDGIHGATFASTEDPLAAERSAVQIGDPFMGKLVLEASLELLATGEVVGLQDMGAAGLTSSSAEMAARAGTGIELDIAKVPMREPDVTPYEAMLSESQERMLAVMRRGSEHLAHEICERWGVECAEVGMVTDDGLLRVTYADEVAAELPVGLLVDGAPRYEREARRPDREIEAASMDVSNLREPEDATQVLLTLLARPTIASKECVYDRYDHMVQAATAVVPGSDAAVVLLPGTDAALAMTTDGNGRWVGADPRVGTMHAVAEAARNLVCSGARPLAVTNCLNFSTPEDPGVAWQLEQSVAGMGEACRALGTPVVGGNVSLYNQSEGVDILPTPVIGMVGVVDDVRHITRQHLTGTGNVLVLVGPITNASLASSEYLAAMHGLAAGGAPPLQLDAEIDVQRAVLELIRSGLVLSAHDVADGGLAVTLAESAIGGGLGAQVSLPPNSGLRRDALLFGEGASRVVLEVAPADLRDVLAACARAGVESTDIGRVTSDGSLRVWIGSDHVIDTHVSDLASAWKGAIPSLMD
jgi:phosphoribosylformylglycinamidine synthase